MLTALLSSTHLELHDAPHARQLVRPRAGVLQVEVLVVRDAADGHLVAEVPQRHHLGQTCNRCLTMVGIEMESTILTAISAAIALKVGFTTATADVINT